MFRRGVLSDKSIKEKCFDAHMPVPVAKYAGVVKPTSGAVLSSIRQPKEFRATARLIPATVAQNAVKVGGTVRLQQENMLEKQLLQKSRSATKNFGILAGRTQNRGALSQNINIKNVRNMNENIEVNLAKRVPVSEGNNPFASIVKEPIDRILARQTGIPAETDVVATAGAVEAIQSINDPTLKSKILIASMASYRDQSPYFAKMRVKSGLRGQPRGNLLGQELVDPAPDILKQAGPSSQIPISADQPAQYSMMG